MEQNVLLIVVFSKKLFGNFWWLKYRKVSLTIKNCECKMKPENVSDWSIGNTYLQKIICDIKIHFGLFIVV